jgi:hypothetical protein
LEDFAISDEQKLRKSRLVEYHGAKKKRKNLFDSNGTSYQNFVKNFAFLA